MKQIWIFSIEESNPFSVAVGTKSNEVIDRF